MTDLGTLRGPGSWAYGINDSGQIVGWSVNIDGEARAFSYSNGVMIDLGTLGGSGSQAASVNANGQVVGYSATNSAQGIEHAFLYSNGVMSDLGALGGDNSDSEAHGINASGQIVGNSNGHAFLYLHSHMFDLGTLGGNDSEATGINASGQIVGTSEIAGASGYSHAFLYFGGTMTDLGTLPGGINSAATSINASGQVVGSSGTAKGSQYAFLYSGGAMTDLNSFLPTNSGWIFQQANGINDSGQIVGFGGFDGEIHAFLLSPISLSPTYAMAEGPAFTLTVICTNVLPGAVVNWNGKALATTYVSATRVTANIPANLIAKAGTASVTVSATEGTPVVATFTIHPLRLPRVPELPRSGGKTSAQ